MSDGTKEEITPIVLQFPKRGNTAVDYIDYFDEGVYGPDKPHFIGRFKTITEVANQIKECLALQSNPNSMIHYNRTNVPDKWVEPLQDRTEKFYKRAKYYIRFILRFKFYGGFGYLDIGRKWREGDILDDGTLANPAGVSLNDLEVVNYCWMAPEDSEYILDLVKAGASTYISDDTSGIVLSDGEGALTI